MHITFVHSHYESLGIEYISAVLKKAGHQTDLIFEPSLFHNFFSDHSLLYKFFNFKSYVIGEVVRRKPDIVAFSVIADNYKWTLEMARAIRERSSAVIVFGGIHTSSVPENVLKDDLADFVVIGEGEYAFLELVNCLRDGTDPAQIPNVGLCKERRVFLNQPRAPIPDLDQLPFPDKDLFFEAYPGMVSASYMITGSRGCNNKCSYCCNSTLHNLYRGRGFFRRRTPENVIAELEWAKQRFKIRKVTFYDEVFTSDKQWLRRFLPLYIQKINLPYFCCSHPEDIDTEVAELLESSGCSAINVGMQTAHEPTLKTVLHRKGSNSKTAEAFSLLRDTRIFVYSNFILGLPGETEEHVLESLRFCVDHPVDMAVVYWLRYYPGTDIISIAAEKGILAQGDVDKINASQEYTPYTVAGNTYNKNISKLGNCILLSGVIPAKAMRYILQTGLYRWLPSRNLLFPLIILSCFLKRIIKGKRNAFHYLSVGDYFFYYVFFLRKKLSLGLFSAKQRLSVPGRA
ncbi:MAG: B12-binding domain-containing radical SAM protein [Candidatus Omnitrophica bacterium]|nr:B12-binding domain-containing radical SAM protein [Candidatus Omnitrophota bacterium]